MGQINCQCQYNFTKEDQFSFHSYEKNPQSLMLTQEPPYQSKIAIIMTLRHQNNYMQQIKIQQSKETTFGTCQGCDTYPMRLDGNIFKMSVRYVNYGALVRDEGIGLGVFVLRKKWVIKGGSNMEVMGEVDGVFVVIKVGSKGQINYRIYDEQSSQKGILQIKQDGQINFKDKKLSIARGKEDKQYIVQRVGDDKNMWVWLGQQTKIKPRDVLRLGRQIYNVQSVRGYLQASKIVSRY